MSTYNSSTDSNSETQKHLVPSGSFLKSGTELEIPTSAQTTGVNTTYTQFADSPNMFLGIIGMILTLLLETFLLVLTYNFLRLHFLVSCIFYIMALNGYSKLGNGIDLKGKIICSIITLIMIYFSHQIALAWQIKYALGYDFATAYHSIPFFLELSSEIKSPHYFSIICAYLVNGLLIFGDITGQIKKNKS